MKQKKELLSRRKFETIDRMLDGEFVLVHVDPAGVGVEVPPHLKGNHTVTLKLSRLFRGALENNEDKITTELLFGSEYFTCQLPYEAIWGATSSEGKNSVWPESAPDAVMKEIMKAGKKREASSEEAETPAASPLKRPQLRRVK